MFPSFLITFREVLEASLIVATVLGILIRLKEHDSVRTVWRATIAAAGASIGLLVLATLFGLKIQEIYSGKTEEFIEGLLMITTAAFITWAVFFLHTFFVRHKGRMMAKVHTAIAEKERRSLFILVFISVFREGFEIVLFVSTLFFSTNPLHIAGGFSVGVMAALLFSLGIFTGARRLPIRAAVMYTNGLLILFAAGLFGRGIHELFEAGIFPWIAAFPKVSIHFLPDASTFVGGFFKALFGITTHMDAAQVIVYIFYAATMMYVIFWHPRFARQKEMVSGEYENV